ncbi:hypothetical protein [Streptomyces umbrinus]|uniref:hypothetical protein n=1 Tax=Streptomyces umbrinus TaxID=67370 RepID=UPI001675DDB8|nr:hypothetical protein [Streptomyces umbrinus]
MAYERRSSYGLLTSRTDEAAGVSLWFKAGVDPVEVARRAGHSPAVLWRFYAKILRGQQTVSNQMIDAALADGA